MTDPLRAHLEELTTSLSGIALNYRREAGRWKAERVARMLIEYAETLESLIRANHAALRAGPAAAPLSESLLANLDALMTNDPWEYYGMMDDQRCFFCGHDRYDGPNPDAPSHEADCVYVQWQTERAALAAPQETP